MTSQLNVDTIVDKAGSGGTNVKIGNTSTYVSEGGAVTQNTVQGLCKAFCTFAQSSSHTINDSFNISGLSDDGAGETTVSYTNVFSVAKHPITGTSNWNGVFTHDTYTTASNLIRGRGANSTSLQDRGTMTMLCGGDLA